MPTETPTLPPTRRSFVGQPAGLSTLFFTEMWERFSYYGMRAILVLYLTAPVVSPDGAEPGLGIGKGTAVAIYGAYSGMVYLMPVAGGWVADRILGPRRTVLYGGIVIALGHYSMATTIDACFWVGLLLIALGTGLLKPNISAMVGDLYAAGDSRRDAGFSIFYMGINIGSLLAPLLTSYAADRRGFHWGFAIAGIGMTIAVIQYVAGRRRLAGVGETAPDPAGPTEIRRFVGVLAGALLFVAAVAWVVGRFTEGGIDDDVASAVTVLILIVPIFYFVQLFRNKRYSSVERDRVKAFIWIFLGAAAFWMVFEQSGSTLTLFAKDATDLMVGSFEVHAGWLQSVNPLFIIAFAPVFAALWTKLANRAPRTPVKFAIALFGVALSFAMLVIPMSAYEDDGTKAALTWLLGTYLLQTWSELMLSPPGLSASSKLAPEGASGQMLALWFLATSVGTSIGGQIGRLTAGDPTQTFELCAAITAIIGLAMLLFARRIGKLMHGIR